MCDEHVAENVVLLNWLVLGFILETRCLNVKYLEAKQRIYIKHHMVNFCCMHLKRENVSWALSPHFIVIVYTLPECVLMISIDG